MRIGIFGRNHLKSRLDARGVTDANVKKCSNSFFISINGHDEQPLLKSNGSNVLALHFDDLSLEEYEREKVYRDYLILFSDLHAETLIEFILQNKDKENCFVHCFAGKSRSASVGLFVNDLFGEVPYSDFMKKFPMITPNGYITATLNRVYRQILEKSLGRSYGYGSYGGYNGYSELFGRYDESGRYIYDDYE